MKITFFVFALTALALHAGDTVRHVEVPQTRKVAFKRLGHASLRILIDGWSTRAVSKQFGAAPKFRKTNFVRSSYGHEVPKGGDEQWIYPMNMGHRLIAFRHGRVILAIEEWSDF